MPDNVYDAVRYSNNPYAQTHPERLATVAILHGLTPAGPVHSARAGDRLRGRRQPDGDGRGDAGHPRAGRRSGRGADRGGPGARSPRSGWATSSCARAICATWPTARWASSTTSSPTASTAGSRPDARDALLATIRAQPGAATASPTSPSTPIPAATSGGCCATSGCWHARALDAGDPAARAAKAQELYKFLAEHRMTSADTYGALLEREVPALAERPDLPARARRPRRPLASGLVRRVRRARRPRTSWATSARPTSTACAARSCPTGSSPSCGSSPAATGSRSRTTPTC